MKKAGFTLIEILVVIAIVGVLLGILGLNYARSIQRANLVEAQVMVATALQRARATAQRTSTDQTVTWTANSLSLAGRSLNLPNGATFTTPPLPVTEPPLTYTAPYGELNREPVGQILTLRSANGRFTADIALVGVTGKVVRRAVTENP